MCARYRSTVADDCLSLAWYPTPKKADSAIAVFEGLPWGGRNSPIHAHLSGVCGVCGKNWIKDEEKPIQAYSLNQFFL